MRIVTCIFGYEFVRPKMCTGSEDRKEDLTEFSKTVFQIKRISAGLLSPFL